ncbi:MAG: PstS family phosphate ABC transporter substrate-binding protein [Alphaproteobacteria bacterium]|nr:PstS family phosphate ABC transporter substrate-binding protein [Alphaproteobacteria bacterium]
MKSSILIAAVTAYLAVTNTASALDATLPDYQAIGSLSGEIKSVGSDTLNNEMTAWAEAFKAKYPDIKFEIEGKGSATAPAALLAGESQFAPMSRPMTADEIEAFEKKYGYEPAHFRVAIDALAVYVNKDNPIKCLSQVQIDRMFSSTRKGSGGRDIASWGDVGLTGDWASLPINFYGRNALSGTYEFFRTHVLYGGDYKPNVKQQIGSAAVVEGVAGDKSAIGYSGLGYKTDGVRAVPVSVYDGGECYETSAEMVRAGKYPIARYLEIYVNRKPAEALDPLRGEFIKFILSKDGQALTEKGGYYSINNEERQVDLGRLGLSAGGQ